MRCDILLPDNTLKTVSSCNGQFTYNGGDDGTIKLWIRSNETAPIGRDGKPSSSSVWTYPQWGYDFSNGERSDNVSSSNNNNNNNNNNYNADNFYLTTSDSSPSVSDRVDLTVRPRDSSNSTVTDYNNDVIFKIYYRTSSSSSRVQTTSSSYFTIDSNYSSDYTDGIRFSSSRYGSHTFSSFIKFKQNYEYKVVVLDADDSSIQGQIIFDVGSYYDNGNSSNNNYDSINGFSSSQMSTVQRMYDNWNSMVTTLEDNYSRLDNSTARHTRSDTFYNDMEDILNDSSNRKYDTYDEFWSGFLSWSSYTVSVR